MNTGSSTRSCSISASGTSCQPESERGLTTYVPEPSGDGTIGPGTPSPTPHTLPRAGRCRSTSSSTAAASASSASSGEGSASLR